MKKHRLYIPPSVWTIVFCLLSGFVLGQFDTASSGYPNFGLYHLKPSNIKQTENYDPSTGYYDIKTTAGDSLDIEVPKSMDVNQYLDYSVDKSIKDYWKQKAAEGGEGSGFKPKLSVENETFDKIFGSDKIEIRPNGSAELTFGGRISKTKNPQLNQKQQTVSTFNFDENIQVNVTALIGDKLKLTTNYNTKATFNFQNQVKLEYTGYEDDIIKSIEAGNVSLPLSTSLITGSQSLFGIKTKLQFGRLMVTSVFSQQQGEKKEIEVQGGAQIQKFEIKADQYDQNRHFFLSHFFRDLYEQALANPPYINSPVNITKIEVWITNTTRNYENTRNVIAFQDLGEAEEKHIYNKALVQDKNPSSEFSSNDANTLYEQINANAQVREFVAASAALNNMGFTSKDYEKIQGARLLEEGKDYFVHRQLGYISLNQEVNQNQVLSVAFQYTYNGKIYQVGDFSVDGFTGQQALYTKMLMNTQYDTKLPMWDLMMKNVYSIGAYQVQKDGFQLEVWYLNPKTGLQINYLPEGPKGVGNTQLIRVLNLDRLNVNNDTLPDGYFDFIDNPLITINPKNGKVYFPVLEPFGSHLRNKLQDNNLADKYAFDSLYTTIQANAQVKFPDKNRFYIKGQYKSSVGSEISLNAINIPQGSVVVTAGGQRLVENQDYTVDYNLGRVTIINQSLLESGMPIKVSLESNSLFNIQTKTLFGSRFDYTVSKDLALGGTIMNLTERPITQKVNIGNEAMANTIVGLDGRYKTESQLITKILDKFPLLNTKETSSLTLNGEVAYLIPGHSRAIDIDKKEGTSYIDDFEGSQSTINLKTWNSWKLASIPQGQNDLFPEAQLFDSIAAGFNRAKLAWYVIDPLFFRNNNLTPAHIKDDPDMQSNHFMREVLYSEVFPNKSIAAGTPANIPVLDLAFYPNERGPYNYDTEPTNISAGINEDGTLAAPETRWGGIMRQIQTSNFEASNVQFIQFWVMDPYAEAGEPGFPDENTKGTLYINLGNISEDILRDSYRTFENGLPKTEEEATDLTKDTLSNWGRVPPPEYQAIVPNFDSDPTTREFQDVGLDGFRDEEERSFFQKVGDKIKSLFGETSLAYQKFLEDPSADDYNFYRDDDFDQEELNILERYKKYNGLEGNSPTSEQSQKENKDGYPTAATQLPDVEDINNDGNMNEIEQYYQYKIEISPQTINPSMVGQGYLNDMLETTVKTKNGEERVVRWYQFRIPIESYEKAVGGISDFRSIRFMRMFLRGFKQPVFLRFATLDLVRGEWRRYTDNKLSVGEHTNEDQDEYLNFDVGAVNIEQNGSKQPVNYVLPPGIFRQQNFSTTSIILQNEQSMSYDICGLKDGEEAAAYRNFDVNAIAYKKMKLFFHAEQAGEEYPLNDGDLHAFIRFGSDFEDNYYEYEIPLKVTPWGQYNNDNEDDRRLVWPSENEVEIIFEEFVNLKKQRNMETYAEGGVLFSNTFVQRYSAPDPNNPQNTMIVVGNPNLTQLKVIMIGVRNPSKATNPENDDGQPKCAEIWINELRLADFEEKGGWGAIGQANLKLADFANISLAGSMKTPGFGSIEQKVLERLRETIQTVDINTTVQLGKLLPDNAKVRLPMFVGYSNNVSTPQYDPVQQDVLFKDHLTSFETREQRDSVKQASRTQIERKSLNFTNVRKEKSGKKSKSHFYDISNFSATYAYTEETFSDINTHHDLKKTYRGGLSYAFSAQPKNYKPFSSIGFIKKSKYLKLIRDFNFYLFPKRYGIQTDIIRNYNERKMRNNTPGALDLPPFVNKKISWNRAYNLSWDFTKSLSLNFTATNNAIIREPDGVINRKSTDSTDIARYQAFKDSLIAGIQNFGLNMGYSQNTAVNYNLPTKLFPLTDWITASARYTAKYSWQRAAFAVENWGHTIQNGRDINFNATGNFRTLYNKVPYFKKVEQKFRRSSRRKVSSKGKGNKKDDNKKNKKYNKTPVDHIVHFLMGTKTINATYSRSNTIILPGFNFETDILGTNLNNNYAPGFGFIFGQQGNFEGKDFTRYAADKGWLVKDSTMNNKHLTNHNERLNLRMTFEPVRDLKITLTHQKSYTRNTSDFFKFYDDIGDWDSRGYVETGNFQETVNMLPTAFIPTVMSGDYTSQVYDKFLELRKDVSQQLATENPNTNANLTGDDGFYDGYSGTSSDVLIPAFVAAYTGKSINEVPSEAVKTNLLDFRSIPVPNWDVKYTGLSKIETLKKYFKTISISHAYKATYNVGGFTSNLLYQETDGHASARDNNNVIIPKYQISTVSLSETFAPLINIDMSWVNSMTSRFEIKKSRTLNLSISNTQLMEIQSFQLTIGGGYIFKSVPFPFEFKKGSKIMSDLNVRLDMSYKRDLTILRRIVEGTNQPSNGRTSITFRLTGDYRINQRLNLRLFYNFDSANPIVVTSFPTSNTNFGITLRFSLAG